MWEVLLPPECFRDKQSLLKLRKNFSPAYRQSGFCAPEKFNKIAICVALPHFLKHQYKIAPQADLNKRKICDSAISVVW